MARNGRTTAAATAAAPAPRAPVRTQSVLRKLGRHTQFALALPIAQEGQPGRMTRVSQFRGQRGVKADWQNDAFSYVETIEPVGYVVNLTANTVAACDLHVGYVEDDGTVVTSGSKAERKEAKAALQALKGPRGGLYELLRRAGLLITICGEFYLLGSNVPGQKNAIWWEALSPIEIKPSEVEAGSAKRDSSGMGSTTVDLPPDSYLSRVWRSDPKYSDRADCALRRCLDTCRELSMLTSMMEAVITSRLAAGLLLIPKTLTHQSPLQRQSQLQGNLPEEVEDEDNDFMDDLLEHLSAPVEDLKSAAAIVPLLVTGEAEDLKEIRTIELGKDLDVYASQMRSEMVRRLAIGLDIPPEILEGKGGLNHWTGFAVDQDFLFKHVQPVGELIADGLTNSYFQPILEVMQGVPKEEATRYVLVFDTSPIAAQADESETAMRLHEAMVISNDTLIEKQGWDPEQVRPTEEELAQRILLKVLLTRTPNVRLTDEGFKLLGLKPEWFEWVSAPTDTAGFPTDAPPDDPDVEAQGDKPAPGEAPEVPGTGGAGPEDNQPGEVGQPKNRGDAEAPMPAQAARSLLIERLRVMADSQRDRVLEIAGARINDKATRSRTFTKDFGRRPKIAIPALVDENDLKALRLTVDQLFGSSPWENLQVRAKAMIAHYLEDHCGMTTHTAVRTAATAAAGMVMSIDEWVRCNLHLDVPYGPDGLRVGVDLIARHIPEPPAAPVPARPRLVAGAR